MGTKRKTTNRNYTKYEVYAVMIAFAIVMLSLGLATYPIDYTNGKIDNETIAEAHARTMIAAQTVPTVVNGIIASTSIIIGFSATLIGLLLREVFSDDRTAKQILIAFLVMYIFAIGFMFYAYSALTTIGQFSLESALRYSTMGLNISIFLLVFVFLFYSLLNGRIKKIDFESCQDY